MFFKHEHMFLQSNVPDTLYCPCGEKRDLHRCEWEEIDAIRDITHNNIKKGYVLRCRICGDMKNHYIEDNIINIKYNK